MSNEQAPSEVWFAQGFLSSFIRHKDIQVNKGEREGYDHYILSSRVDKMIRLALLEKDLECEVSCYGHNPVHNVLKSEINQLREELK